MTATTQTTSPIKPTVQEEAAHPRSYYIFWALSVGISFACAGIAGSSSL